MKLLQLCTWVFFMSIPNLGVGQWYCPWEFRQEIELKERALEDLSDYQIKLEIPFKTGMNLDYSDLRFTMANGTSPLSFYLETFDVNRAIVWVKIPLLLADDKISIFLYYCNPSTASASDPQSTFLFYDDFDSFSGWVNYASGTVTQNTTTFPGVTTMLKDVGCDPSGGYKLLGESLSSFRLIVREHRKNEGAGCGLNRYGLVDDGFDGYSLRRTGLTNGNGSFGFERRNNGNGSNAQTTNLAQPHENWYRTEFTRCERGGDGLLETILYDDGKNEIGNESGQDNTYDSFDRVSIHGGRPYYFDYIAVGKFVCREPRINFKSIEADEPVASCMDVTVVLDMTGNYVLDPEELDGGSSDCNTLTFSADQTLFTCDDLGENKIELTVTDPHGEKDKCEAKVFVIDLAAPQVVCPDDITLTANENICSVTVNWAEPTVTENCEIVNIKSSHESGDAFSMGTTIVEYEYTDQSGNIGGCTFSITVLSNASPPQISISENSGNGQNDGVLCDGDEACLNPTAGFESYAWNTGSSSQQLCVNIAGTYTVIATNNIGCTASSAPVSITALDSPIAGTCLVSDDLCQLEEGAIRIQASNGAPPYTVNWVPAIGTSSSGTIQNSGEFLNIDNIPGGTTITISIVDDNGCTIN